jgi:CDP-diacylglycerol--glycerol-3-phosphate 3-phosphatidyltransferase
MFKLKNLPNILSGLRILLTPFFLLSILRSFDGAPTCRGTGIILYGVICLTDFCDGKTARFIKAESRKGMVLDLVADSFFILSSSLCLWILKVLPVWAPLMILFKLLEFIITSRFLGAKNTLVFDPVGRVAAVSFYVIPIWTLLFWSHPLLMALFLGFSLLITLVSSSLRIRACLKSF